MVCRNFIIYNQSMHVSVYSCVCMLLRYFWPSQIDQPATCMCIHILHTRFSATNTTSICDIIICICIDSLLLYIYVYIYAFGNMTTTEWRKTRSIVQCLGLYSFAYLSSVATRLVLACFLLMHMHHWCHNSPKPDCCSLLHRDLSLSIVFENFVWTFRWCERYTLPIHSQIWQICI